MPLLGEDLWPVSLDVRCWLALVHPTTFPRLWLNTLWVGGGFNRLVCGRVIAWKTQCPVFRLQLWLVGSRYGNSFEVAKTTGDEHCKQSVKSRCL